MHRSIGCVDGNNPSLTEIEAGLIKEFLLSRCCVDENAPFLTEIEVGFDACYPPTPA